MFSSATKVKGQGVGSAYLELINLLKKYYPNELEVRINELTKAPISHYHTVDFKFFLSTFLPYRGVKVGYVHFLPETLEGSLKLPWIAKKVFYKYLIRFYKRMDCLVVVNPMFISKLEEYGIDRNKITYIPNFVSKDEFYVIDEEKSAIRQSLNLDDKFTIMGAGQVQERKGVFDFIELAKQNPQMQFVWVGGFSFGKLTDGYNELKRVIDNPPQNLKFPGIVSRTEMNRYYNASDVYFLPSYNELFPMTVLEAFNTQTPVVLRDLELYHSIIEGYFEPVKTKEDMQVVLQKLMNDNSKLKDLAKKSKQAAQYYSEERLAKVWFDFYQSLLEDKNDI